MKNIPDRYRLSCAAAALLLITGCGGEDDPPVVPVATTTNVSTTVIDGAIRNAIVCLDKNANGKCDADETQGKTDAAGNVTLAVPNADVGKYALVAMIGTDAVDADNGAVTVAYTMAAPADQAGVVSPLTTLVHQTMATTGASSGEAAKAVQDQTGITTSMFQDFTKVAAPTDGSVSAAAVARLVVVTTQRQSVAVASTVGTPALGGARITQADLDKAIQQKLLELLPALVTALSDPAVLAASTPAAREAALLAAATTLVSNAGLTPAAVATVVAINKQPVAPATAPAAFVLLDALNFTDASNYSYRTIAGSLAQNTPDASNNVKFVERRARAINGNLAKWASGGDPTRGSDLHWDGTAWAACPINFENTASIRDAQGNGTYNYCGTRETGRSSRASFDVSGRTYLEVYSQIRDAGYTNLTIGGAVAALGTAKFPEGSSLLYQTNTPLSNAIAYLPVGANSPAGTSSVVARYSAAVAAGGSATTQPAGTGCNTFALGANGLPTTTREIDTNGSNSSTLEGMIAASIGTPCVYGPSMSFTYQGVQYTSTDANATWGATTLDLGTLGSAPVNFGTAPGFYTGNTRLRVAFTGGSAVAYYSCKQRFDNGGIRACTPIGSGGTYTITTLGNARALSFNNLPAETSPLNYKRVYFERGGLVYFGYQSKPVVTNRARLNTVGSIALLGQLGLTPVDPSVPWALTAGSYVGAWDVRDNNQAVSSTNGTTIFVNGNGTVSCQDKSSNNAPFACSVNVTDPATGAFTYASAGASTATGTFNFLAGTTSGNYVDPSSTPPNGNFVGGRR